VDTLEKLPRVDIIYAHANMSADLIEAAVRNGAQGIVVAGVGDGNMTAAALDALAKLAKSGTAVVRSTRLPRGSCCGTTRSTTTRWVSWRRANSTREVARPLAARADQDQGPGEDPGDVPDVLSARRSVEERWRVSPAAAR
jgi:hypothetical protein